MNTFKGTGVALVTPFLPTGAIDWDSLQSLINHTIANGVNYLVSLGTTAETPTLSHTQKLEILNKTIEINNNRVPIVVGIGGNDTHDLINSFATYPLSQCQAILSVSPYYNKPVQEGIYQHYKAIAQNAPLPIILYNVPGRTGGNIMPATTLRLAHEFSNIIAIKEASGNLAQCMEIIAHKPKNFIVISGDDNYTLPYIAAGMQGVISVAANCFTKDFCAMVTHALNNEFDTARRIHYHLLQGMDLLFTEGNPAGAKAFLQHLKIINHDTCRLPLISVTDDTRNKITEYASTL